MTHSRIAFTSLAILLIAILLAWFRLPVIIAYLLEQELRDAGFSEISIDIARITSKQTRINAIQATHPATRLAASSITIKYSLNQLWQGEVESVSLDALQITPSLPRGEEPAMLVLPALPANWLEAIPFHSATFDEIILTLPETAQGIETLAMQMSVTHTSGQLQINADLAAAGRPPLHFTLSANSDNTLDLAVHEQTNAEPFIELHSHALSITPEQLKTMLNTRVDLVALRNQAEKWLPEYTLPTQFETFTGKGDVEYTVADRQLRSTLDISLSGPDHTVRGPVVFSYQPEQLSAIFEKHVNVAARQQRIADMLLPAVAVRLQDAMHCTYQLAEARWQCGPTRLQLDLPEVQFPAFSMQSKAGLISLQQLSGNEQDWRATANIELDTVNVELPNNAVRIDRIFTQLHASSTELSATTNLQAADNRLAAEIKAVHNLRQQRGTAEIVLQPVSLDATYNIPGKLLQRWPYPVHIAAGMLHGHANLEWHDQKGSFVLNQSSTLVLDNIRGQFQEFPFTELTGTLLIKGIDSPRIEFPTAIRLAEFNPGVEIKDAQIRGSASLVQNRQAVVSLAEFSANLLGGKVYGQNMVLDFNREKNPFILHVERLDISELIMLEQKQGLFGTGTLDGSLPLTLGKDGLRMEAGNLTARAPGGVIRYTGDERVIALARSNPNVELLLKALSDFRYNLLEAKLDYAPDGQLQAKLRLQGKNPELEGGRPVHLNINLEENILTLLRSLQFADEISRKIGESIERGNKPALE